MELKTRSEVEYTTGQGCLGLLLSPVIIVLNGYILNSFWVWFVVSFVDVKPLGIARSIGLSCLIALLRRRVIKKPNDAEEYPGYVRDMIEISGLLISFGIGWLAHRYV